MGVPDDFDRDEEPWTNLGPDLNLAALDDLETDGVNIRCVNSSDFVVGRQTNFNGPVTIINCESAFSCIPEKTSLDRDEGGKEEIVIRDRILSNSATATMQEMALKKTPEKGMQELRVEEKKSSTWPCFHVLKSILKLSLGFWIGFAVFAFAIVLTTSLVFTKAQDKEGDSLTCPAHAISTDIVCLYGDYEWGGRDNPQMGLPEMPFRYAVVAETGGDSCFEHTSCLDRVRNLMEEEEDFISGSGSNSSYSVCNFFIGGDGNAYEDVGWNGTNSVGGPGTGKSLLICLIGDSVNYPTYPQLEASRKLIELGVKLKYLSRSYVLTTVNATDPDVNVSSILYKIVKKWPRFYRDPFGAKDYGIPDDDHVIYSKDQWGGAPATSVVEMKLPIPYIVISHSVTVQCPDLPTCGPLIKSMQAYHQSLAFADIAYNFLVDSSGNIYEGRGWSRRNVAGGFINGRNIDINLIGDFSRNVVPTSEQMDGLKYLIRFGLDNGIISEKYSLLAANATFETLSPGKNVYEIIKTWPHFDAEPEAHLNQFDD